MKAGLMLLTSSVTVFCVGVQSINMWKRWGKPHDKKMAIAFFVLSGFTFSTAIFAIVSEL